MNELKSRIKEMIVSALELEDVTAADIVDDAPLFGESEKGLGLFYRRPRIGDCGQGKLRSIFLCGERRNQEAFLFCGYLGGIHFGKYA